MQASFTRYLVRVGAVLAGTFLVIWLYVALMQMAYMEGGYPAWIAKSTMLARCHLGEIAFFGDSKVEAGVVPAALPVDASNFGLAAGTAVETGSAVRRAMNCPDKPRQAVISLSPEHFGPLSRYFWLLSLRYGFIGPDDLRAIERLAAALHDTESFATPTPDGFSGTLRDWLYELRFPPLSFSSLVTNRVFGRLRANEARLAGVLQSRGWSEYVGGGAADPTPERMRFVKTELQTATLESTLRLLRERDIPVRLLIMPFSESDPGDAALASDYVSYLTQLTQRFPGVELVSTAIPRWPASLFADNLHLNGAGAKLFSARLAACMSSGLLQSGCDLAWRGETAAR